MSQYQILYDEDIAPLGDAVLEVLRTVGVLCQSEELTDALEVAGGMVDGRRQTVRFPRNISEAMLIEAKTEADPPHNGPTPFSAPGLPVLGTQIAQIYYDYGSGQRRQGNSQDLISAVKLGESLHGRNGVGHCLLLTDVPPMVEPLEAAVVLAEHATEPGPAFAWSIRQVDYLREMGEILGIEDWFTLGAVCFAHPLRFDKDVADRFVAMAKGGLPVGLTAMPVAGLTTPISVAGFITVAAAEIFVTWMAARVLNPDAPLRGSIWGGAMDMRTGEVSFSTFDAMFYSLALSEFFRKWTGHEIAVGGGEYSSAREPGYYAAMEKAHKAMTIAAFTGHHPQIGQGMLESGKTLCPVQLLLEREMSGGLAIYGRRVEVSEETIGLETIQEVGFGLDGHYLETDDTLRRYRDFAWCPELLERDGWVGRQTDERVLGKLQERVNEHIDAYDQPDVDPSCLAAMRQVVDRARRELLG